ncbi:MAG: lysylphosphatidylglycerol synthase transmembrane domain-containing protein [Acidimicrobiales bacterium]
MTTSDVAPPDQRGGAEARTRSRWRRWRDAIPRPVRHLARLGIMLLIVEYLVLPQIAGSRQAIHLVGGVSLGWLLLGLVLEASALFAYAQVTRAVLPARSDPGIGTVMRIQLTTLAVSHCVPGGTAAGSPLGYRLLTQAGVAGPEVGFALATQGLGSALVLNAVFWLALVVSIPIFGFSPVYASAALVGVVLLGAFSALVLLLTRGEERAASLVARVGRRLPYVDEATLPRLFHQMADRVAELAKEPRVLVRAVVWAALNWLLDAASLFVFVGAFGHWVNPDGLLVAYGLANVLAAIPVTPGGLGVVETVLTSTLVGFGTPRGVAILGVLAYRLVNFWLPIPIGGLTYLSLQVQPGAAGPDARRQLKAQRREALRRLLDQVGTNHRGTGPPGAAAGTEPPGAAGTEPPGAAAGTGPSARP